MNNYDEAMRWAHTFLDNSEHWSTEDRWTRLCDGIIRILNHEQQPFQQSGITGQKLGDDGREGLHHLGSLGPFSQGME